jgi:deazaflavin-dependent oxidoreductase (nitroreductase family)
VSPEPKYLYLTTTGRRTGRPREIEIWFTRHRARYYLVAEHGVAAQWVQNLLAHPTVRARVGAQRFRGRARVVDARAERALVATVRRLSEAKYGWGAGLVVEIAPLTRRRVGDRARASSRPAARSRSRARPR